MCCLFHVLNHLLKCEHWCCIEPNSWGETHSLTLFFSPFFHLLSLLFCSLFRLFFPCLSSSFPFLTLQSRGFVSTVSFLVGSGAKPELHCMPKSPLFYFSNNSVKKTDFNDFWCVNSWENLTSIRLYICPPYLYTVSTLPLKIQKSDSAAELFIHA